jgi:hypothetical protein
MIEKMHEKNRELEKLTSESGEINTTTKYFLKIQLQPV